MHKLILFSILFFISNIIKAQWWQRKNNAVSTQQYTYKLDTLKNFQIKNILNSKDCMQFTIVAAYPLNSIGTEDEMYVLPINIQNIVGLNIIYNSSKITNYGGNTDGADEMAWQVGNSAIMPLALQRNKDQSIKAIYLNCAAGDKKNDICFEDSVKKYCYSFEAAPYKLTKMEHTISEPNSNNQLITIYYRNYHPKMYSWAYCDVGGDCYKERVFVPEVTAYFEATILLNKK